MKKKVLVVIIFTIFLGGIIIAMNRTKIETSHNVEMIKENFPKLSYIDKVDVEIEKKGGILPSQDGPVYRGYIFVCEEGIKYYKEKYSWNTAQPKFRMSNLANTELDDQDWFYCNEFMDECVPEKYWGNFYYSESGVICFEFTGH